MILNNFYLKLDFYEINYKEFISLRIIESTFEIPFFELKLKQLDYSLLDKLEPFKEITITFGISTDVSTYKFLILDYEYSDLNKEGMELTLTGILSLKDFIFTQYQNANKCNLSEYLQNLKYIQKVHIDNSNDTMIWLQPNISEKEFIQLSIPFMNTKNFPNYGISLDGLIVKDYDLSNIDWKFGKDYQYEKFKFYFNNEYIIKDALQLPVLDIKNQKYAFIQYKKYLDENKYLRPIINNLNVYESYYNVFMRNISKWNELYKNNIEIQFGHYYLKNIKILDKFEIFMKDKKYQSFDKKKGIITKKENIFKPEGYNTILTLNYIED